MLAMGFARSPASARLFFLRARRANIGSGRRKVDGHEKFYFESSVWVPPTQSARFFQGIFGKTWFSMVNASVLVEGRHDTLKNEGAGVGGMDQHVRPELYVCPRPRPPPQNAGCQHSFVLQGRHITPPEDTCPPHPETRNQTLNCVAGQQREDTTPPHPETRNPPTLNCVRHIVPPTQKPETPSPKLCCWSTKRRHITPPPRNPKSPNPKCVAGQQREDTLPLHPET